MAFTNYRLSKETVNEVERLLQQKFTYSQIVKKTGVSKASISKIKNGTYKKDLLHDGPSTQKEYYELREEFIKIQKENIILKKENEELKASNESLNNQINSLNFISICNTASNLVNYNVMNLTNISNILTNKIEKLNKSVTSIENYTNVIIKNQLYNINDEIINLWKPLNLSTYSIANKLGIDDSYVKNIIENFNKTIPDISNRNISIERKYRDNLYFKIISLNDSNNPKEISNILLLPINLVKNCIKYHKYK